MPEQPVRTALTNDFELVVAGLARMLAPYADRVQIVDLSVRGEGVDRRVDVALFDTFGHPGNGIEQVRRLVADPDVGRVALFTWQFDPVIVDRMTALGCTGYLSKALDASALVGALERIASGHRVVSVDPMLDRHTDGLRDWPGRADGLSGRESEVLVLIAEGLSNLDIAEALFLSPNSIKSHIRAAYRKLGVTTRAQAVRAVLDRGMVRRQAVGSEGW
ncbi:MAG: helix-turn-helix transcriptional regulator [Acidimicrobiia bacterium]